MKENSEQPGQATANHASGQAANITYREVCIAASPNAGDINPESAAALAREDCYTIENDSSFAISSNRNFLEKTLDGAGRGLSYALHHPYEDARFLRRLPAIGMPASIAAESFALTDLARQHAYKKMFAESFAGAAEIAGQSTGIFAVSDAAREAGRFVAIKTMGKDAAPAKSDLRDGVETIISAGRQIRDHYRHAPSTLDTVAPLSPVFSDAVSAAPLALAPLPSPGIVSEADAARQARQMPAAAATLAP